MLTAENALRSPRYQMSLPLRVWFLKRRRSEFCCGSQAFLVEDTVTENISVTGCHFLLSDEPMVGSQAEMEITIPIRVVGHQTYKILCQGQVLRVEQRHDLGKVGVACTIQHHRFQAEPAAANDRITVSPRN